GCRAARTQWIAQVTTTLRPHRRGRRRSRLPAHAKSDDTARARAACGRAIQDRSARAPFANGGDQHLGRFAGDAVARRVDRTKAGRPGWARRPHWSWRPGRTGFTALTL